MAEENKLYFITAQDEHRFICVVRAPNEAEARKLLIGSGTRASDYIRSCNEIPAEGATGIIYFTEAPKWAQPT